MLKSQTHMTKKGILDTPKTKRPRERLLALGVHNLTELELIALLLSSGTKKKSVLLVARDILKNFALSDLPSATLLDLAKISGVGAVKAGKILAGIELGRRCLFEKSLHRLVTPNDVSNEVKDITTKSQEYLVALYLNARHELLQKQTVSVGGLNQAIIEPRDIFSYALILPSPFIILAHNHPSGEITPSKDDIKFTQKIIDAGELLGITIVDHIIVTAKDYYSFKESKLI